MLERHQLTYRPFAVVSLSEIMSVCKIADLSRHLVASWKAIYATVHPQSTFDSSALQQCNVASGVEEPRIVSCQEGAPPAGRRAPASSSIPGGDMPAVLAQLELERRGGGDERERGTRV